jgi:hypothetical protein
VGCEPPKRVRIVRCPECGSTDAGADESQSAYDLTWMQCGDCGNGALVDTWQIQFDWNLDLELASGEPLPEYLPPLPPGEDLVTSLARAREKS